MFKQGSKEIMKFALIGTILMSVVGILGTVFPLAGILVYPAAIFFFICGKKTGFIFTLPFVSAAFVFAGIGTSFVTAIADVLGPGLAAAMMGELLKLTRPSGEIIVKGIGVGIMCELGTIICLKLVSHQSILEGLRETMNATLQQATESGQVTIHSADMMRQSYEYLLQIIPGLIISFVIIGILFIYFEGTALLHRTGEEMKEYFPFRELSFPRRLIWGFLLMFGLGFLAGTAGIVNRDVLLLNICIVMWTLVCIQGVSMLAFLWHKPNFPRWIYIVLTVLLCFSTVGTILFFLAGMVDLVFNIRRRIDARQG